MNKKEFEEIYKKYNEFDTLQDRFKFCMEVLRPCKGVDISNDCRIPLSTVTRIKNGLIFNPNPLYCLVISKYFNVNQLWLFKSKYFPASEEEYKKKCIKLSPGKLGTDIIETPSKDKKRTISKNYDQLGQDLLAFANYKELLPLIFDLIESTDFVKKIKDDNESFLINEINLLKDEKDDNRNNFQNLAKKTRSASYEELTELLQEMARKNVIDFLKVDDDDEEDDDENKKEN